LRPDPIRNRYDRYKNRLITLGARLTLEILTGVLLSLVYAPDAGRAYSITADLLGAPGWSIILNFHYWNAFLIFGLVMVHLLRVFISGGYLHGKQGLWLVGVVLAGLTFLVSLTGETLHWDEVGSPSHGTYRRRSKSSAWRTLSSTLLQI
jgi:quinol-cytochrome oxidoreductase complex cytochrome b subunit